MISASPLTPVSMASVPHLVQRVQESSVRGNFTYEAVHEYRGRPAMVRFPAPAETKGDRETVVMNDSSASKPRRLVPKLDGLSQFAGVSA